MKGEIILMGEEHKNAAERIVDRLFDEVSSTARRYTMTVAAESGSDKSETGHGLRDVVSWG